MNNPSLGFSRQWILKKPDSFRSLYRTGRRLRGETITLFYRREEGEHFLVGFTTRKKLAGSVGRNRVRRLMREVIRIHQHEIPKDLVCLFLWQGSVEKADFFSAEDEMMGLLRQGGLLL